MNFSGFVENCSGNQHHEWIMPGERLRDVLHVA
jgi:hypothetical protein